MSVFIPEGYNRVMPYLILQDAAGFVAFAKNVLDAAEKMMHRKEDGTVMHAEVLIGDSVIMIGESSDQWSVQNAGLYIQVANADETYRDALAAGAASVMQPADQSYGRSCGIKDPFGNTWWVTSNKPS